MAGTTYAKFFWQDWVGDDELALCSMRARGTWMCLLVIAARSTTPGHVLLGGKKPSLTDLRQAMRCPPDFTDEHLQADIDELSSRGVCSLSREGIVISRRMVRDAQKSRSRASGGRVSSSVTPRNERGIFISRSEPHRVDVPATINHQPESINHQPSTTPTTVEGNRSKAERVNDALGRPGFINAHNMFRQLDQIFSIEQAGADFDLDLLAVIQEYRHTQKIPSDLGGVIYFKKGALAHRDARLALSAETAKQGAERAREKTSAEWTQSLRFFVNYGFWHGEKFGPSPIEDGCMAPKDMLAAARRQWNGQGQIPDDDKSQPRMTPTPFWGDNVVALPARTG